MRFGTIRHSQFRKEDTENKKAWNIKTVSQANIAAGQPFFLKDTMRFTGDAFTNYHVLCRRGEIFVLRTVTHSTEKQPIKSIYFAYPFDPATGLLGKRMSDTALWTHMK